MCSGQSEMSRVLDLAERMGTEGWITREVLLQAIIRDKQNIAYALLIFFRVLMSDLRGLATPVAGVATPEFMSRQMIEELAERRAQASESVSSAHLLLVVLGEDNGYAAKALITVGVTAPLVREALRQNVLIRRRS